MQHGPDTFHLRPIDDEPAMLVEKNGAAYALVHFADGEVPTVAGGVHGGADRVEDQIIRLVLASIGRSDRTAP